MSASDDELPRTDPRISVGRALVIDADLPPRLRGELRNRGIAAQSAKDLGWRHKHDVELARLVHDRFPGCVLVTGDDAMPGNHDLELRAIGATVATVDSRRSLVYRARDGEAPWRRHIVHMWAHRMQLQPDGSFVRYGLRGGTEWAVRTQISRRPHYLLRAEIEKAFPELSRDQMNEMLVAVEPHPRKWSDDLPRWSYPLLEQHVVSSHQAGRPR